MSYLSDNVLHLPEYQVLSSVEKEVRQHFHMGAPDSMAYEDATQWASLSDSANEMSLTATSIHGRRSPSDCSGVATPVELAASHSALHSWKWWMTIAHDSAPLQLRRERGFQSPCAYVAVTRGFDEKTVREIFRKS